MAWTSRGSIELSADTYPPTGDVAIAELAGLVVVPLRSAHLNEEAGALLDTLSARLARVRSRGLILDLSAIATLDSHEFAALARLARLGRLLGCDTVAAGITPGVAACMVMIDADPQGMRFCRDMDSVLLQLNAPAVPLRTSAEG